MGTESDLFVLIVDTIQDLYLLAWEMKIIWECEYEILYQVE
jgi:hypothetical protein